MEFSKISIARPLSCAIEAGAIVDTSVDNFIQLSFFLEDLLKRRVELVTPESISPYIRPYIMNEVEYVT